MDLQAEFGKFYKIKAFLKIGIFPLAYFESWVIILYVALKSKKNTIYIIYEEENG